MASKVECDKYASELTRRFEELTKWAIANWPRKDVPLMASDFSASRRELASIVGPRLGDGGETSSDRGGEGGQYVDVNPMPWP
jgi:hypothetical protein